jgi:hypothetical protein
LVVELLSVPHPGEQAAPACVVSFQVTATLPVFCTVAVNDWVFVDRTV